MLAGAPPYTDDNVHQLLRMIASRRAAPSLPRACGATRAARQFVAALLEKEPSKRLGSRRCAQRRNSGDASSQVVYRGIAGVGVGVPLSFSDSSHVSDRFDDEADDGTYKFKVQRPRRDYPPGHPLWSPPCPWMHLNHGGSNAMQIG